jgi:hypothetical protein
MVTNNPTPDPHHPPMSPELPEMLGEFLGDLQGMHECLEVEIEDLTCPDCGDSGPLGADLRKVALLLEMAGDQLEKIRYCLGEEDLEGIEKKPSEN